MKSNDAGSGGDAPIDVTDPWRGLYKPERLVIRHAEWGDVYHPDTPSWPDDREDALDKLVRAQGFDFHIVAGEFSDEAMEDGDELYWQEMRAWNPEAPEGDWRLAWKGDTEDGPYAWFVRPMALRPDPEELAARQPVGVEPAGHVAYNRNGDMVGFRQFTPDGQYVFTVGQLEAMNQARPESAPHTARPLYTAPPAPSAAAAAAVPVDGEDWRGWATQYPGKMPVLRGSREIAELNYYPEEGQRLLYLVSTTHPQPAAAGGDA